MKYILKPVLPYGVLTGIGALLWLFMYAWRLPLSMLMEPLLIYGEVVLPALLGCLAATTWMGDGYREVLMTYPYRPQRIVGARLACLLGMSWLSWTLLVLAGRWSAIADQTGEAWPLWKVVLGGGVAQLLALSVGSWLSLRLHSVVAACMGVVAGWGLILALRKALLASAALVHPLLSLEAMLHPLWPLNRLILALVSIMLLLLTLWELRASERFLPTSGLDQE